MDKIERTRARDFRDMIEMLDPFQSSGPCEVNSDYRSTEALAALRGGTRYPHTFPIIWRHVTAAAKD